MSTYKQAREEADKYDPALCLAAMELLPRFGLIDRYSNPVFVRPSLDEDQKLGIDMHMHTDKHYRLAFRTCEYLRDNILIRDKEMEKIRAGEYQADFFIIGVKNPEDYSLSAVRIINIKNLLEAEKYSIEYDALIEYMVASPVYLEISMPSHLFGEKRPDKRENNTGFYLVPIKAWLAYCYYQTSLTGHQRREIKKNNPDLSDWDIKSKFPSYKAGGIPPNIFNSIDDYNRPIEENKAYAREQAKDLCDTLGLDACDFMRQMYEL
jgi:hypothetical protein